jgi:penicillin G amidase
MTRIYSVKLSLSLSLLFVLMLHSCSQQTHYPNLLEQVEVIRDENGINHIFAANEQDLFFAQGYLAAKDRLFQFELWRRQATGTLSEILGEKELERDKGARLFQFRGDKQAELNHYHPRGELIVDAFVKGVNTYIKEVIDSTELLPVEFKMLDILPGYWTWEVVVSRHQGLLQNVKQELNYSRIVSLIGEEKTKELHHFHPFEPELKIHPSIPVKLLFKDIIAPYDAFRSPVIFHPEDVSTEYRNNSTAFEDELKSIAEERNLTQTIDASSIGSNNWVVSGNLSASGFPIMANDPHRLQSVPSLRYWVHLHAPGWNVIGGGEPVIPGISLGHNETGAWGLTIFQTDNEDLRIYDLHPEDPLQYQYKGKWLTMKAVPDTIFIKNRDPEIVTHYYSVHGPITFIDEELHKAVAIQCAWLEPGGAPYLASLRMGQAASWEQFREACRYNHIPALNMVWADKNGNIGWQATGIAPIRKGFSGLVATSGDGSQDWAGYQPMLDRPHGFNPPYGYFATANENQADNSYPFPESLGFTWADAFRGNRIKEVLGSGKKFTLADMGNLQNDYLSLPARQLVTELSGISLRDEKSKKAQFLLNSWDYILDKNSKEAAIYVMWERKMRSNIGNLVIPQEVAPYLTELSMTKTLAWIKDGDSTIFGHAGKSGLLSRSLEEALLELERKLGPDWEKWQYGQPNFKHALIRHPLSVAISEEWRRKTDLGPLPRGGYSFTPGANAYGDNNTTGASLRIIVDTGDWEKTLGINTPGQSGDIASPFYSNLFPVWANDGYFMVPFEKIHVKNRQADSFILK